MCNFVSTFTQHESGIGVNAEAVTTGLHAAHKGLTDRWPHFGPAFFALRKHLQFAIFYKPQEVPERLATGRKNPTHMLFFWFKNVFPAYKHICRNCMVYLPTGPFYASSTAISTFVFVRL